MNSKVDGSIPEGGKSFFFLKICFWSVNRDPVLRICHRPVWQSVKVCHSKQFTDSQKQICNRPETESVCYLGCDEKYSIMFLYVIRFWVMSLFWIPLVCSSLIMSGNMFLSLMVNIFAKIL